MSASVSTGEGTSAPMQAARFTVVLAVVLTAILEVLDTTIVNVALPSMKAAFGMTDDQTTWILTSYIVAAVVVMPLTGLLARRFGRRRLISTAIIGFTTFSALCGLAWSLEAMVMFRLGQGMFGAFLIPLSQSILLDSFPKEKRGQAMALFGLGIIVAPILGPTLGAVLTEYFSWRAVFYVNAPVAAFALFMMMGELKDDEPRKVTIDWIGLALMVVAIGALQLLLDQGASQDWLSSRFIQVCALLAIGFGSVFLLRGWNLKSNIIDLNLFRDRSFAAANFAILGFGLGMYGTIALLPLFVQGLLGFPILESGYLFMPRGAAAAFSMVLTGVVLMRYFDPRLLVAVGLLLTGFGNLSLGWLNINAGFWDVAAPGIVSGLGMGLFFVPMSTLAFQNITPGKQDEASGLFGVMRSLGSSIGIALVSSQFSTRLQFHWSSLAGQLTPYDPSVQHYLEPLGLSATTTAGVEQLSAQVATQAQMLAYQDVFIMTGWASFILLPLVFMMERPKSDAPAVAAH